MSNFHFSKTLINLIRSYSTFIEIYGPTLAWIELH